MVEKTWWQRYWGAVVIIGLILFFILAIASTPKGQLADLNASVEATQNGVYITNNESSAWTNCMVGVNSQDDMNAYNPPYQTQSTLTFAASEQKLIPYQEMTASDGTIFDVATHAVNSIVIVCNHGTTQARYWRGSTSSD